MRLARVLLAVWALAALGLAAPPAAAQRSAYVLDLLGVAWDHTTLTYSVQADSDVSPSAVTAIRAAVREWNVRLAQLGGHYASLRLAPASGPGADIPIALRSQSSSATGLTSTDLAYQTAGCWLLQAPIVLSVLDDDGAALPDDILFSVAAHELGHALGLGHARAANDLMYPTLGEGRRGPSALDLRGVRAVYAWLDTTASTPAPPRCPRARGLQ